MKELYGTISEFIKTKPKSDKEKIRFTFGPVYRMSIVDYY